MFLPTPSLSQFSQSQEKIYNDSLVTQVVKKLSAMWETWVPSLGREDSPGEGKGYPFQYPGLENSVDCTVCGVKRVGHKFHFQDITY